MTDAPALLPPPVLSIQKWATNSHLIADCARLGYLRKEWRTMDPTYGEGVFWSVWQPDILIASDLDPAKSPSGTSVDFRKLPYMDRSFEAVVFDPPYKLNGTPTEKIDGRYGVAESTRWQDRMTLMREGVRECARCANDVLLVKCQDQVVSGRIRWQTLAMIEEVEPLGFGLKDRLDFLSHRAQPKGRRQLNAERCSSQLLVFKRGWKWSDRGVFDA